MDRDRVSPKGHSLNIAEINQAAALRTLSPVKANLPKQHLHPMLLHVGHWVWRMSPHLYPGMFKRQLYGHLISHAQSLASLLQVCVLQAPSTRRCCPPARIHWVAIVAS